MLTTDFQITGLNEEYFSSYYGMEDAKLSEIGIRPCIVDVYPGYPCRVSLEDAKLGEEVLLLNYEHHAVNSPYRASGPVFVRKNAIPSRPAVNEIPVMLEHRLLSLRGYDREGIMLDAQTTGGADLKNQIHKMFENKLVNYIHIHNAGPGCFNCAVHRVS